jgi:hypothetical protein
MEKFGQGLAAMVEMAARSGKDENAIISFELMPCVVRIHVQAVTDEAFRHASYDYPYDGFTLARLEFAIGRAINQLRR